MRVARNWLLMTLALALSGCALDLLNAVSPDGSFRLLEDIEYGAHPRQRLDLALPRNAEPRGVIVFFYGGGWADGSRDDYRFVLESFAREGYAVALPDYRLYPEVRFPAFVEDAAAAVAWVHAHRDTYGLEAGPLVLMGHSAGAHLAAMVSYAEGYLERAGVSGKPVDGFVGLAGPYDFLPIDSDQLQRIFYPPSRHAASQPVNYVDADDPPALLVHGLADVTVWPRNSLRMAGRIRERGGRVRLELVPDTGHRKLALALSATFNGLVPTVPLSLAFIETLQTDSGRR